MEAELPNVKIGELRPYQNRFRVVYKVIDKGEVREITSRKTPDEIHRMCNVTVADDTGTIILTAWDDDIDFHEVEEMYAMINGYVNIYRDSMRLARGRYGHFEATEASFDEVNLENRRSEEIHERRPRKPRTASRGPRDHYGGQSNYRDRW